MDWDHVIRINADGEVEDVKGVYAPDVFVQLADDDYGSILKDAEDEMVREVERQGWELMTGYSGQYGYHGPIMHVSEYVGGGLERDIRETPGLYVVVAVTGMYATEEQEEQEERNGGHPIGWVIARKVDE
jgi:hypothetical protein